MLSPQETGSVEGVLGFSMPSEHAQIPPAYKESRQVLLFQGIQLENLFQITCDSHWKWSIVSNVLLSLESRVHGSAPDSTLTKICRTPIPGFRSREPNSGQISS